MRKKDYTEWVGRGIGTKPDSVIAAEYGIDRRSVCTIRHKLEIPAFVGFILTQEGFPCRSIYEAKMDAYFHEKNIKHEHEVPVLGGKYIADFKIYGRGGYTFVEVLGMMANACYRRKALVKHKAYDAARLPVWYIEPNSVEYYYSQVSLPLSFRNRICVACGCDSVDLVKGLCRTKCYMKKWRSLGEKKVCANCGKEFSRDANKYCSRACYWASLVTDVPSQAVLYARKYRGGLYADRLLRAEV